MKKNYITPALEIENAETQIIAASLPQPKSGTVNTGDAKKKNNSFDDFADDEDPARDGNMWNYSDPLN